jgi:hypothetical protein
MWSKVTMSNAVGSQRAVRGIHPSAHAARELYASMIILVAIQVRLRFKSAPTESDALELNAKHTQVMKKNYILR